MGIFEWVKGQTGIWGPSLLDLYLQNAGWINAVFLVYGVVLLLSWQNLSRIYDSLVAQIVEQAKVNNKSGKKRKKTVHLSDFHLSWEEAIRSSRFPFVARQMGFLIYRSTPEKIRALITDRELVQHCAARMKQMDIHLKVEK